MDTFNNEQKQSIVPDNEKRFQPQEMFLDRYPLFVTNDTEQVSPHRKEVEQLCRDYAQSIKEIEKILENGESVSLAQINSLVCLVRQLNKKQRETATVRGVNEALFDRLLDLPESEWESLSSPTDSMDGSPINIEARFVIARHLQPDDLREITLDQFIGQQRKNKGVRYGSSAEEYRTAFDRYTTPQHSRVENYLYALISTLNEGLDLDGAYHFLAPLLLDQEFRSAYPDESRKIAKLYFNTLCLGSSNIRRAQDAIYSLSQAYGFETSWDKERRMELTHAKDFLHSLLSYDNENLTHYVSMMGELGNVASENPQPYSDNWHRILNQDLENNHEDHRHWKEEYLSDVEFFKTALKDNILIDLGSGGRRVNAICSLVDLEADIGVEKFHENGPLSAIEPTSVLSREQSVCGSKLHISVHDDMLDFVARVKNDSSIFMLNGIDYSILQDQEYRMALAKEIIRATKEEGIVFGVGSDDWLRECFAECEGEFKMTKKYLSSFSRASGNLFYCFVKEKIKKSSKENQ